jgi:hypothetical protein
MDWKTCILSRTRDRLKHYVFGVAPYVESNANDDHAKARRLDYSVLMLPVGSTPAAVRSAQPGSRGPWTNRVTGATATGFVAWTLRVAGNGETRQAPWIERRAGNQATGTITYLFRAEGTRTTPATAWQTRRTGTLSS